jgi:hypothetical protein
LRVCLLCVIGHLLNGLIECRRLEMPQDKRSYRREMDFAF